MLIAIGTAGDGGRTRANCFDFQTRLEQFITTILPGDDILEVGISSWLTSGPGPSLSKPEALTYEAGWTTASASTCKSLQNMCPNIWLLHGMTPPKLPPVHLQATVRPCAHGRDLSGCTPAAALLQKVFRNMRRDSRLFMQPNS